MTMLRRDQPMPIGMDDAGLAHPLRTDASGRLELVLASGGAYQQQLRHTLSGTLSVGSGALRFYNRSGNGVTIGEVHLAVGTAPAGAALIVDVHKNGTTIFTSQTTRPQVAAGSNDGYSATVEGPTWAAGEYLTIDIDQVGSSTPGADLAVTVVYG